MILESPFSAPVRLEIPASRSTVLLIILPLLFVSVMVFWFTPWPWYLALLPGLFCAALAGYFLKLHYWQQLPRSVLEINQDGQGQWAIRCYAGDWQLAKLMPDSFVSTLLVIMNFTVEKRRYTVILPAGSLDKDTFRRLRVRIRVGLS